MAPSATLLGFAAWRDGNGPLAAVALERALLCDPDYSLAQLIWQAMFSGVPGTALGGWPDLDAPDGSRQKRRSIPNRRTSGARRSG